MLFSDCIEYFERASLTMALGRQRLNNYSLSQKSHAVGQSKASHTLNIDGLYFGPKMYSHLIQISHPNAHQ